MADTRKRPHDAVEEPGKVARTEVNGTALAKPAPRRVDDVTERLAREVLCRWWYGLPDWPPPLDWRAELRKRGYREVDIPAWEDADDPDGDGLRKAYAIGHYPGLFRNAEGKLLDLRPQESCPCYNNMVRKSKGELAELLAKCYANQIVHLTDSKDDQRLREKLKKRLEETNKAAVKWGMKPSEIPKVAPTKTIAESPVVKTEKNAKGSPTPVKSPATSKVSTPPRNGTPASAKSTAANATAASVKSEQVSSPKRSPAKEAPASTSASPAATA
jgi:hypothetical protein